MVSFHSRLWLRESTRLGAGKTGRSVGCSTKLCWHPEDLNRQEKWAVRNLVKFNQGKCKVLPLGRKTSRQQNMPGAVWLKASLQRRMRESWWAPALTGASNVPTCKKGQQHPGLHWEKCHQQTQECDSALVTHPDWWGWTCPSLAVLSHLSLSAGLGRLFLSCRIPTLIFKVPSNTRLSMTRHLWNRTVPAAQWVPGTACWRNPREWILQAVNRG